MLATYGYLIGCQSLCCWPSIWVCRALTFDGITRHNPEGMWFRRYAQAEGFKAAVQWRDSGQPIPEGDDARARIAELEALLAQAKQPKS